MELEENVSRDPGRYHMILVLLVDGMLFRSEDHTIGDVQVRQPTRIQILDARREKRGKGRRSDGRRHGESS